MLAGVWQNLKRERMGGVLPHAVASDWQSLSGRQQEAVGFLSADFMLPVLAQNKAVAVDTIRDERRLLMAMPVRAGRFLDRSVPYAMMASTLPQIDGAAAPAAVAAYLHGLRRPMVFHSVPACSAFHRQLQDFAPRHAILKRWQRAALRPEGTFEGWMAQNFDQKRRKELKRLRNRLSEQGDLKLESLNQSSTLQSFVENLLEVEAQGWKGAQRTAIKANPALAQSFREICSNLNASGSLRFWQLTFNGKAIASLFGMVQGAEGWIVKIAYDESFAKYSPGVLLIIEATQSLFAEPGIKLVDSCAIPDHPMINRIWRDRIEMVDVLVAPAHVSGFHFGAVRRALMGHDALRARAKSAYYAITKRKKS